MDRGYIKLWRKIEDSGMMQDHTLLAVWVWLMMKACHKKQHFSIATGRGSTLVTLERGQLLYGRNAAAKSLKLAPSTMRNKIVTLERLGNISQKPDTHYTIITICNYDDYQDSPTTKGQPKDNQRTTKGQPKDTYKNDKNDKNDKKIYISPHLGDHGNVKLTEGELLKLKARFNGDCDTHIQNLSEYLASKGDKYKSHYATILSWHRRNNEGRKESKWGFGK